MTTAGDDNGTSSLLPPISGWGRYPAFGREVFSEDLKGLTKNAVLSRGLGRSYGDSSLPPPSRPEVAATPLADRVLAFDETSGRIRAEAGLSLAEMNRLFLPRGWFTPVTPGTQFVTLGGMVAADVHGKNHHQKGCFGHHVTELLMRAPDGSLVTCSREERADLFLATVGGMGLTGHILEVEFCLERVASPWIWAETERIGDLGQFLEGLREATRWPYTVGWIDCVSRGRHMGRGILSRGRWATAEEAPPKPPRPKRRVAIPFDLPGWLLNPLTVRAFNMAYYWKHQPRVRQGITHPETFFYPLDAVHHWNRVYGRRGFTQYQCVIPREAGTEAVHRFLELLTTHGGGSMLSVIKDCGDESDAFLSFPRPGISIALDFPVRSDTQRLVDTLNALVIETGGRVYLAKDAFTRPEDFLRMEPRLEEWQAIRRRWDPELQIRSAQSVRMLGDPP